MMLEPDGIDSVEVLIKVNDSLHYYVTDKETWILNNEILYNAFRENGYEISKYEF